MPPQAGPKAPTTRDPRPGRSSGRQRRAEPPRRNATNTQRPGVDRSPPVRRQGYDLNRHRPPKGTTGARGLRHSQGAFGVAVCHGCLSLVAGCGRHRRVLRESSPPRAPVPSAVGPLLRVQASLAGRRGGGVTGHRQGTWRGRPRAVAGGGYLADDVIETVGRASLAADPPLHAAGLSGGHRHAGPEAPEAGREPRRPPVVRIYAERHEERQASAQIRPLCGTFVSDRVAVTV